MYRITAVVGESVSVLDTPGFVYFVQGEDGSPIKIGWATKPEDRVAKMQSHCPVLLRILLAVPGDGRMERVLHQEFAAARKHGEWFDPVPELLVRIEDWRLVPPPAPQWPERRRPLRITPNGRVAYRTYPRKRSAPAA